MLRTKHVWIYTFAEDGSHIGCIWTKKKITRRQADMRLPAFLMDNNLSGYLFAINEGEPIRAKQHEIEMHQSVAKTPKVYKRRKVKR